MNRYSVNLRATFSRDVEIEAESPEEAVRLVAERCGGPLTEGEAESVTIAPESVEELGQDGLAWDVIGACESCGTPLLDAECDNNFTSDENGVKVCLPCDAGAGESGSTT